MRANLYKRASTVVLLAALLLALPALASARTAGRWAPISSDTGNDNSAQPWLVRVAGGGLLVAYEDLAGAGSILTSTISPAGDIAQGPKIVDGWASVNDPAIVPLAGGLTAFFGGIHTTDVNDPNQNLNYGTAPGAAGPWTVTPNNVASPNNADDQAYGGVVAALALRDGAPVQAWAVTNGLFVHRGFDQTVPEQNFQNQLGGCCAYDAQLALDGSTGTPAVAWYSNATGKHGVWYQTFDPATATPTGAPVNVPQTSANDQGLDLRGRVPLTGCPSQPGNWIAAQVGYPSQNKVILWKAGSTAVKTLSRDDVEVRNVALACGPDGRLWVAWARDKELHVVRSNPERTDFGTEAVFDLPNGTVDIFDLVASAQENVLDLVANLGTTSGVRFQAIQVLPALDLAVRSTFTASGSGTATIKATVTDAGDPVKGVTVKLAGKSAKTNKRGVASVTLRHLHKTKKYKMTASLRGYTTDTAKPKVKVKS